MSSSEFAGNDECQPRFEPPAPEETEKVLSSMDWGLLVSKKPQQVVDCLVYLHQSHALDCAIHLLESVIAIMDGWNVVGRRQDPLLQWIVYAEDSLHGVLIGILADLGNEYPNEGHIPQVSIHFITHRAK